MSKRAKKMRIVCEFNLAKPGINDDRRRDRTRIVEDENGIWRLQSKSEYNRQIAEVQGGQDTEGWFDEFRLQEDWPAGDKIGTLEYGERVLNVSSALKAAFEAGRKA